MMKGIICITLLLFACMGKQVSLAQKVADSTTKASLSKYVYITANYQKPLTQLIVDGGSIANLKLVNGQARWLKLKGKAVYLKSRFIKKATKKKAIGFSVKNEKDNSLQSFSIIEDEFNQNKTVAHRGAWKKTGHPQNSLAGLKAAMDMGCEGSEFDIHLTADTVLVINHDPHFGGKPVQQSTYDSLATHRLANGEKLPLLRDFIQAGLEQRGTKLVLEIKPSVRGAEWAQITAQKVVEMVHQMQAQAWCIYISFDYEILRAIRKLDPTAHLQYLAGNKTVDELKHDGIQGADYHFSVYQKDALFITTALQNKLAINAWTVNEISIMDWLLKAGANWITTDEPALALERNAALKKYKGFN